MPKQLPNIQQSATPGSSLLALQPRLASSYLTLIALRVQLDGDINGLWPIVRV
jgi:hypothetical protein